jgi:Domain of unknown function (DUF362)
MAVRPLRRDLLVAGAAWLSSSAAFGCRTPESGSAGTAQSVPPVLTASPAPTAPPVSVVPDPMPPVQEPPPRVPLAGHVVEVTSENAVKAGIIQSRTVGELMTAGMLALTGAADEASAWRMFFDAKDIVGIKVNPVGYPAVYTNPETLLELVRGLGLAGVPPEQIVVFDRYRNMLSTAEYARILPVGVRILAASDAYQENQTGTAGYDLDEYVDIARVMPGDDLGNPLHRRSHLCNIVSNIVSKVINVPNLKDHRSAGITMALKNMVYGSVNNVARTHAAPDNWTRDFVPAVLGIRKLREKYVLHIADALMACYAGGPAADSAAFKTYVHVGLLFATDPVAMDRIGWQILDAQRLRFGLPRLADTGLTKTNLGFESFSARQPEHVIAAGDAGFGIADLSKIHHQKIRLG